MCDICTRAFLHVWFLLTEMLKKHIYQSSLSIFIYEICGKFVQKAHTHTSSTLYRNLKYISYKRQYSLKILRICYIQVIFHQTDAVAVADVNSFSLYFRTRFKIYSRRFTLLFDVCWLFLLFFFNSFLLSNFTS